MGGYYKPVNLYGIYRVIFNSLELFISLWVNYSIYNIVSDVRTLPSKSKLLGMVLYLCLLLVLCMLRYAITYSVTDLLGFLLVPLVCTLK